MNNFFKNIHFKKTVQAPYLGGEKSPRPYRDWYFLVATSLLCLLGMITAYGYGVIKITDREALSSDALLGQSLTKISPAELERITIQIKEKETIFLQLLASSTPMADPSR